MHGTSLLIIPSIRAEFLILRGNNIQFTPGQRKCAFPSIAVGIGFKEIFYLGIQPVIFYTIASVGEGDFCKRL